MDSQAHAKRIITSVKYNNNFAQGEADFITFLQLLQSKSSFCHDDISAYQKTISTLVRYAPTPERAIDYTCFALRDINEPLTDECLEHTLIINCIYVYSSQTNEAYLRKGLELIQVGLARGFALPSVSSHTDSAGTHGQKDVVFDNVARRVLRHFNLRISSDRKRVQPR